MSAIVQSGAEQPRPSADEAGVRACALLVERGRLKQDDLARAERLLAEAPENRLTALLSRLGLVRNATSPRLGRKRCICRC